MIAAGAIYQSTDQSASRGTEIPSFEPLASTPASVPVVESAADSEPATGNEERTEGEHGPAPEAIDAAHGIADDKSPDSTNTP